MLLYTLGHSNHPREHFLALLHRHRITTLVDVRSRPYSRWAQFRKPDLTRTLAAADIRYVYLGRELGGLTREAGAQSGDAKGGRVDYSRRRQEPDFAAGIARLVALASAGATVLLCAEENPAHCHRELLLGPPLREHGAELHHIRGDGRIENSVPPLASQLGLFDAL